MKDLVWITILFAECKSTLTVINKQASKDCINYCITVLNELDDFLRMFRRTVWISLHLTHLCNVCLVNRSPHRPCHLQRPGLHRPLLLPSPERSPKSPHTHPPPPPPPWPCCVSFRRLSTGSLRHCSSSSHQPEPPPPSGGSSSLVATSRPLPRDSLLSRCTRLWI